MNFLFTLLAVFAESVTDKVGLVLAIMMLACGFFWSTREIWCWYMKSNEILGKSNEILLRLEEIEKRISSDD